MISNLNFTAPEVPLPPAYTQAIPKESGIAMPPCLIPKLYLPTLMRSTHRYMLSPRNRMDAMQGVILLICIS
jgi:hypothetical protein